MTELEREMYKIITEISNANVPIIFKGAMVTKLVLDENEYIEISRGTKDIDANWVGEIPPAEEIEELINNSLSENTTYRAEVYREFSVSPTTLGIRIFNSTTGERVVNMDIDIRPIVGSQLYYYGETTIALLDKLDNKRIKYYTGATTSADSRTLMNIFSSALSKLIRFIDAELEQAICDHSERLNDIDFINKPTAIFLICPDENTTRHFFASLFLRYFSNDLIEQAEEEHNGILPRKVIFFCDEFGNLPPINDVDVLFSAIRGRGVRIAISLQSYNQLYKSYSKEKAEIIKDTCQMVMSGFVAPSSHDTAKTLSEMLGNETVMTGSVNRGDKTSTTTSMIGKPLISISEWVTLPHGTYILQKGGYNPLKTEMKLFFDYLPNIKVAEQEKVPPLEYTEIQVTDSRKLQMYANRLYSSIKKGMFD